MNAITDQLLGPGDGKSPCTMLNVLRLAVAGKIAVLFNVPDKDVISIKSVNAWRNFIAHCSDELRRDVKERATPDEWRLVETSDQPTLLSADEESAVGSSARGSYGRGRRLVGALSSGARRYCQSAQRRARSLRCDRDQGNARPDRARSRHELARA
jgi:hypothetical protein